MAHRIGLNDTVYEPDIHDQSQVDFSFFDDHTEESLERTKGQVQLCDSSSSNSIKRNGFSGAECSSVVNGAVESSGGSSYNALSNKTQLISAKPKPLLEDTSCAGQGVAQPEQSGWCLGAGPEGHQEDPQRPPPVQDHVQGNESRSPSGSVSGVGAAVENAGATEGAEAVPRIKGSDPPSEGASLLAAQSESAGTSATNMERADLNAYSSDEWEDSEISDSASDHSDSSDDDDPKSQVDRLIERGTRLYMDGTDSNVSESDSSDDDDDDFSDSESDITDVSPLVSGACSPMRLSPTMSRRSKTCRSPLAIHDNKNLEFDWSSARQEQHPQSSDQGYDSTHTNQFNNSSYHHDNHDDPTDMTLLLQAVIELEKTQHKSHHSSRHRNHHSRNSADHPNNHHQISSPQPLSSIHASPHTRHLSTPRKTHSRKNMSFTNEEVRRIDRENQILLQKIMTAHTASKRKSGPVHKPSNSSVTRKREEEKIRRENMILLRKIQEAKPSRDVAATTRSPRYHHHHRPSSANYHHHHHHHHIGSAGSSSNSGNSHAAGSTGTGSCAASARSAGSHGVGVATTTSRKETAL